MNMTDPIADMLTRIRNGVRARLPKVDVPASKLKVGDRPHPEGRGLHLELQDAPRTANRASSASTSSTAPEWSGSSPTSSGSAVPAAASTAARTRSPGCTAASGINILSTSRGLMTGRTAAREGVGGEILCNVW